MKILVTGAAGFIGYHVMKALAARGDEVTGLDSLNSYYDVNLKYGRLAELGFQRENISARKLIENSADNAHFVQADIADADFINGFFDEQKFEAIVHLAAQAGVRYSLECPEAYIKSNIIGFFNLIEAVRKNPVKHFVFASSSSIYGKNEKIPFSTQDKTDSPVSLYAATKKADELMAHAYSHLHQIPMTGLRFFTVYGPWGRPDMALFLFTRSILAGKPIDVFNYGNSLRDYTYIDDICEGIIRVLDNPPDGVPPFAVYNIGCHHPVKLLDFIEGIEDALGKKAIKNLMPMPTCDVPATFADIDDFIQHFHYHPQVDYRTGIQRFVDWYRKYYSV